MEVNKKTSVGDDGDSDRTEEVEIEANYNVWVNGEDSRRRAGEEGMKVQVNA